MYVDENFTPEEEESIRQAAGAWSNATDGVATVDLIFGQKVDIRDKGRRVMVRSSARAAENTFELFRDGDPGGRHESWDSEVIVIVPERMDGIDLKYVVTHELGHHFGVHHVADESAIMYFRPNPKSAHCLTKEDLSAFCGENGCNASSMKACDDASILR
ncbi:MAG: matrixin family metalloprotease [Polyangiaceae bacterium]